jgi:hypothetical protein
MKPLSEYKDDECFDLLDRILDPVNEIMSDKEMSKTYDEKGKFGVIRLIIKKHRENIVYILATLNNVEVKDYHYTFKSIIDDITELSNDEIFTDFYQSLMTSVPVQSIEQNITTLRDLESQSNS